VGAGARCEYAFACATVKPDTECFGETGLYDLQI
jgi:hypothetical protein